MSVFGKNPVKILHFLFQFFLVVQKGQLQESEAYRREDFDSVRQTKLIKELLDPTYYNPSVRPVKNVSHATDIRMGMTVRQIRTLNMRNQYIQLQAWLRLLWNDELLRWNASEYAGIKSIRLPSQRIWRPDLTLFNNADIQKNALQLIITDSNVIVHNDGSVRLLWPAMITASCDIDVTYFPFDKQQCVLRFGSWTYDGLHVNLYQERKSADLSKLIKHTELELLSAKANRNVEYYVCCPEPYVDVQYILMIQRQPLYYTINFILPCAFIEAIAVMVFMLPPECGEKVSLSVTLVLGMTVLLLVIAENMPPNSLSIPLIGIYFMVIITLSSCATMLTVFVLNVHYHGQHGMKVPNWLKRLALNYMAKVLCMYERTQAIVDTRKKSVQFHQGRPLLGGAEVVTEDSESNMLMIEVNSNQQSAATQTQEFITNTAQIPLLVTELANSTKSYDNISQYTTTNHLIKPRPISSHEAFEKTRRLRSTSSSPGYRNRISSISSPTETPLTVSYMQKFKYQYISSLMKDHVDKLVNRLDQIDDRLNDNLPRIRTAVSELQQEVTLTQKESMEQDARMKEWQLVASVADRLFFYIFLIFSICFTCYVFLTRAQQMSDVPDELIFANVTTAFGGGQ